MKDIFQQVNYASKVFLHLISNIEAQNIKPFHAF